MQIDEKVYKILSLSFLQKDLLMEKTIIALIVLSVAIVIYNYSIKTSRLKYLETYRFHPALRKKVLSCYPLLSRSVSVY